jgi:hypothetical protein
MDPRHAKPVTPGQPFVLFKQLFQASAERTGLRPMLFLALVTGIRVRRPDALRTVLRDSRKSRAIALIGLPSRCSRRILVIVSTTNIPVPAVGTQTAALLTMR